MLKRILVGLVILQFSSLPAARAGSSDVASIRSMRASALQHCAQGEVDLGLKTFEDAIRLAEKTFGKDSTYVADLCFDAGMAALNCDRYQKAEDCLTKSVGVNPNSNEARLKLAEYYKLKGRLADAKQQVAKVLSRDPVNAEAHEILALTYQKEGNVVRANEESLRIEQRPLVPGLSNIAQGAPPVPALGFNRVGPSVRPTAAAPLPENAVDKHKPAAQSAVETSKPSAPEVKKPTQADTGKTEEATAAAKHTAAQDEKERTVLEIERVRLELELAKLKQRSGANNATASGERHRRGSSAQADDDTGVFGVQSRMHSKAVLLTPVRHARHTRAESMDMSLMPSGRQPRAGRMVPPPPPVVPMIGAPPMMPMPRPVAPPTSARPPAAQAGSPLKLKEGTPREDPGDEARPTPSRASSESHADSHGSGSDDDADFLLDWAGKKKKKSK